MDRIWAHDAGGTPPTYPTTYGTGYANDSSGTATTPGAWWYHMVTEEILGAITAAGISPSGSSVSQLTTAIQLLAKQAVSVGSIKSVRVLDTVGVTLTGSHTVDGISLITGDRVLRNVGTDANNGVWVVNIAGAWTRPTDFSSAFTVPQGMMIEVSAGTANANSVWTLNPVTGESATVDTTAVGFTNITATLTGTLSSYLLTTTAASTYALASSPTIGGSISLPGYTVNSVPYVNASGVLSTATGFTFSGGTLSATTFSGSGSGLTGTASSLSVANSGHLYVASTAGVGTYYLPVTGNNTPGQESFYHSGLSFDASTSILTVDIAGTATNATNATNVRQNTDPAASSYRLLLGNGGNANALVYNKTALYWSDSDNTIHGANISGSAATITGTYGGTLTGSQVTTAVPNISSFFNVSGYLTSSAYSGYLNTSNYMLYALPIAGGTLTGNLYVPNSSIVSVGGGTSGYGKIQLTGGSSSGNTGHIDFVNSSGGREGYIGNSTTSAGSDGGTISYVAGSHSFAGGITSNGNITGYYSDARLKKNVTKIENAVQKVLLLGGYEYDWDLAKCSAIGFTPGSPHEHGLIAQTVQQVVPDAAVPAFNREYLTVNYDRIVALLSAAIGEQQQQLEVQQDILHSQQEIILSMLARLKALEEK